MELPLSYGTHITSQLSGLRALLSQTGAVYTEAVKFFAGVCEKEWSAVSGKKLKEGQSYIESLTHITDNHPDVKYSFDEDFPNFPSYLRRAAISDAIGSVKSYHSNHKNWEKSGKKGKEPSFPKLKHELPAFYYGNMFIFTDENGKQLPDGEISEFAKIKVFCNQRQLTQDRKLTKKENRAIKNKRMDPAKMVWDWIPVHLKHSDIEYLKRMKSSGRKILCPTLRKKGPLYMLQFGTKGSFELSDTPVQDQTIVSVDLGINTPATCCVMKADGTILARRFYKPERDMGLLQHWLNRVSRAQSHGSRKTPGLWSQANNRNRKLSDGTADFIISLAEEFNADVIVFEHLELTGKKRGQKKVLLHHWRAKYVQELVSNRAHARGMHIATVCAWGTSKLAFDGTGEVERKVNGNYSVCKFKTGKIYNCDLSASYNIGARYFIREICRITSKTMAATAWSELKAKVPELMKRTTCTLSTLISLNAGLKSAGFSF